MLCARSGWARGEEAVQGVGLGVSEGLWGGAWQVAAQLSEVQSYTSLVLCCFAAVRDMVVDFVVLML